MIYLIRSYGLRGKSFLKVGFTDNPKKRFTQYFYHNPGYEVISKREGDEVLESLLHLYLRSLGLQYEKLNEWFIDSPEVYQVFHLSRVSLERRIWRSRGKIFDPGRVSVPGSPEYLVFESLWRGRRRPGIKKKIDKVFWVSYMRSNPDRLEDYIDSFTLLGPSFP